MKPTLLPLIVFAFLLCSFSGFCKEKNAEPKEAKPTVSETQTLQIVSTPELERLAQKWTAWYTDLHPDQKIVLNSENEINSLNDGILYLTEDGNAQSENQNPGWKITIGHEPVVAVINSKNPAYEQIGKKGFTAEDFAKIIAGNAGPNEILMKTYFINNNQVISKITAFAKINRDEISSTQILTKEQFIGTLTQNVNSIGFCLLADVLNLDKTAFLSQISIVPVDKNRNGRIDSFENIYTSPEKLTRGAWIGKYPKELCIEISAIATSKPTSVAATDFLAYVTGEGQELVANSGYSILSSAERTANRTELTTVVKTDVTETGSSDKTLLIILIAGIFVVAGFFILLFRYNPAKQNNFDSEDIELTKALNENSIHAPKGLLYDKTHTWAFMEQDGLIKIGIDDFMKRITGKITQLKIKNAGEKIRKGEKLVTIIHDGKQLNLYSPVSGNIKGQNEILTANPADINKLSTTEGWICQVEPSNWERESGFMFMVGKYREWLKDEFSRLKDFLALTASSNSLVYEHIVLQDGGELKENVLADMDPQTWEDFQTKFIDTSK